MPVLARQGVNYAEYRAMEELRPERHEWYDGQVFAMAGGTEEHSYLAAAAIREMGNALRGRPCRAMEPNLRIRSEATGLATYADAVVVRAPRQPHPEDPQTCVNPTVVVEVLSPSTEAYDRGQEFEHYRSLP